MSKGMWLLGAGLAVVGTGFAFSVVHASRLSEQVQELERKVRDQGTLIAKAGQDRHATAEGTDETKRLWEELESLRTRLNTAERSTASADRPAETGATASTIDAEIVDRVLKEQKVLQQKQKADKKAAKAAQKPAKRMASRTKSLQLTDVQAESVKPVFEEYDQQSKVLSDKRKKTPKNDRSAVDQEIVQLRRATFDRMRPYLTEAQVSKADYYFNAPRQTGGAHAGERVADTTASGTPVPR